MTPLDDHALDQLFRTARTHNAWLDRPVPEALLRRVYDIARWGPTSANGSPARFVFVQSAEGKRRLLEAMSPGNQAKTAQAPVTVIVAWDTAFHERLPELFPHADARAWYIGKPALLESTAFRNSTLQGAYLMLAARALGLDCGPMSGFDAARLEAAFFADGAWKVNFVCNLGYGDPAALFARSPRLTFDDACRIA